MSEAVSIQGVLAPYSVEKVGSYHYRPMPDFFTLDVRPPRLNHYTKNPAQAAVGELVDASMNEHGVVEAGYKRAAGVSKFDWFQSTDQSPRG